MDYKTIDENLRVLDGMRFDLSRKDWEQIKKELIAKGKADGLAQRETLQADILNTAMEAGNEIGYAKGIEARSRASYELGLKRGASALSERLLNKESIDAIRKEIRFCCDDYLPDSAIRVIKAALKAAGVEKDG